MTQTAAPPSDHDGTYRMTVEISIQPEDADGYDVVVRCVEQDITERGMSLCHALDLLGHGVTLSKLPRVR